MMIKSRRYVIFAVGILLSVLLPSAFASCTNSTQPIINLFNSSVPITVNPNVSIGSVLASGTVYGNSSQFITTCTTVFNTLTYQGVGAANNNVYPTTIPGIGIKLSNGSGSGTGSSVIGDWPVSEFIGPTMSLSSTARLAINYQLIKTGPIADGGTLPMNIGSLVLPQQGNFVMAQINFSTPMTIILVKPTCLVVSPLIVVLLNIFPVNYFSSVGSTSSPIPFNIQVTCVGGTGATTTQVSMTLTDTSGGSIANLSNTLTLSPLSTASGVGIQIRYNGVVRSYGLDSSLPGNLNQFLIGNYVNGIYSFPFYTYLIRTGNVTAGTVISTATFTMSYQ